MQQFLGEFECKVDSKGRFKLPSTLIKQMGEIEHAFVVNRGLEKCLVLYPKTVWDSISKEINQLNMYNQKNRKFARYFYRGATELSLDSSERINLPKRLLQYAGVEKEIIVFAYHNKIELWSKDEYDQLLDEEPVDFANLAEEVMGKVKPENNKDVS